MSTHTPGPWHKGTLPGQALYIFGPDGKAIVQATEERHVSLIAAAPELLEALKACVEALEFIPCRARNEAHAVIAKAEGRV